MTPLLPLAAARQEVADFLGALLTVYVLLILAYIVMNLLFAFGARPAYNRYVDMVMTFLRQVAEPYLRIFRRFIPPLGPFDFSPIVAIIVLQVVGGLIISAIHG